MLSCLTSVLLLTPSAHSPRSVAGPVSRVTLLRHPVTRAPSGSAFLEFLAPDARNKALALTQSLLLGEPIVVLAKGTPAAAAMLRQPQAVPLLNPGAPGGGVLNPGALMGGPGPGGPAGLGGGMPGPAPGVVGGAGMPSIMMPGMLGMVPGQGGPGGPGGMGVPPPMHLLPGAAGPVGVVPPGQQTLGPLSW